MPDFIKSFMNVHLYQQTLTFERVFDIVRQRQNEPYHAVATFSFESAGKIEYGAGIRGNPELKDGMSVTALLKKPGDWHTIVGWVNHETGEVICPSNAGAKWGAIFIIIMGINAGRRIPAAGLVFYSPLLLIVFLVAARSWYRLNMIRNTLDKLAAQVQSAK